MSKSIQAESDPDFLARASAVLDELDAKIDRIAQASDIDLEINRYGGLLEIELADRSKVVIHSQEVQGEIWVAAKAGGFHFYYDKEQQLWRNTQDGRELYQMVAALLTQQSGVNFAFA
jgi:CyaY protein